MIERVPPAALFISGALVVPFVKGWYRQVLVVALPLLGFMNLLSMPVDTRLTIPFLDFEIVPLRVDRLSLLFGYIFHLITFIAVIYMYRMAETVEYVAGFIYAGAALGATFAGDLFTFFVFWELLTIGSVLLIWARKTREAQAAGFRYLMVHVFGGLVLLAGIVLYIGESGSVEFGRIGLGSVATYLIFLGIGINCAWPVLHSWLTDAYPAATIGGTIFLSAFTTKTAVYALARAFPGTEALVWIGVTMAAFPIFYAVIENDLRRVLAYSLINQVGFMVVGIGIGTELSINGAAAHAFNDVLFKALLFMSVGAVMHRTGTAKATQLGGLYKSMPWTALFCIVGAASISAFPLFSGFVSKSMVMEAAAQGHLTAVWLVLLFASAGVFHHAGIKIPFFAFFGHDAGHRVKEAPFSMLVAMGITALLCVFIGSFPEYLYRILPFPVEYEPYTLSHVLSQTELLFFSALAFTLLLLSGLYPAEIESLNVDSDWFYRKGARVFYRIADKGFNGLNALAERSLVNGLVPLLARLVTNLPVQSAVVFMSVLWRISGLRPDERLVEEKRIRKAFGTGTFSIGVFSLSLAFSVGLLFLFIR